VSQASESHRASETVVLNDQTTVEEGAWVYFWPVNDWQRKAICANGFKLASRNCYCREDDEAGLARYAAKTVREGGVG
jgi:hypothetical protein